LRMEHISGAILLLAALWIGGTIILKLRELREYRKTRRAIATLTWQTADKYTSIIPLPQTWRDDPVRASSS
jgi:hypothetical protein